MEITNDRLGYLRMFHPISRETFELLMSEVKTKTFQKGSQLVVPGQIQKELYFVESGIQMSHFESEKKTHVIAFTYPPNVCAIPESFTLQKEAPYFLTCLTDSTMHCLSFETLQRLMDESREIERLFRKMTEYILAGVLQRHLEMHTLSIKSRYLAFCSRSLELLHKIPHKYIASYLNIDPTNFSKLYNQVKF